MLPFAASPQARSSGQKRRSEDYGDYGSESPEPDDQQQQQDRDSLSMNDISSALGGIPSALDQSQDVASSMLASDLSKRCRVQSSPGELRLRNDVKEVLSRLNKGGSTISSIPSGLASSISIVRTSDPMCILIEFSPAPDVDAAFSRFSYQISRHYPHERPVVRCVYFTTSHRTLPLGATGVAGGRSRAAVIATALAPMIDPSSGLVTHDALTTRWTGVSSLTTAVEALVYVRQMCAEVVARGISGG